VPLDRDDRYTLTVEAIGDDSYVMVDLSTEGLGEVLGAVLEQLDNEDVAQMVANQIGPAMALELGQAIVAAAATRQKEAAARVTQR